ncbi:MAG: carbon starvation protein A [Bacteriovoracaceae bacterium]|jgi:carbon starvation protein|nr:carbon starvation protein A [Bacteriovoracaceae bacterium]
MNAAIVGLIGIIIFLLAYRFYGTYISDKILKLQDETGKTPSQEFRDDIDFVPTKKGILVGHHFSSIAGAAPIVGPAVAVIWGWLPAMIWVICGVVFMGACHDFGALYLSMKHKGDSMASVADELLGKRSRILFLVVIFFLVWMVIAVFALVIANLFIKFPGAVIPVNFEIFIALAMGLLINKKQKSLTIPSIMAQALLIVMIIVGTKYPISLAGIFGENQLMVWVVFLMLYSFVASILPVWTLLQPRDYINSHQLVIGLGLMVIGLFITQPQIVAPVTNFSAEGAPPWFPFLFITIACGAISGFHGLVSGGTTSKQVAVWTDAKPIGYGSMLGEGLLALLATLAVTAGFKTSAEWHVHYGSWSAANGLSAKISAFVHGAGEFVSGVGIPQDISKVVIAVLIISFAATSLDTACRIQRYIIGEFGKTLKISALENRFTGSAIAVISAFLLMLTSDGGKGGLHLWPLFGATNQMLAGLTLILISVFLIQKRRNFWPYLLPAIFVIIITAIALSINIQIYVEKRNWFLTTLGVTLFLAQVWIIAESVIAIRKARL